MEFTIEILCINAGGEILIIINYIPRSGCSMDSLYLTGLPDSLSLQEMLDCDMKTEMDVDDCFSLGELPPLALEDSLDAKWEFIDTTTSGK